MISRILVLIVLVISMIPGKESNELINSYCQDNAYDPKVNTTYRTNLNTLLSNLSEASRTKDFYRFQAGKDTSEPTYGLYLCRGDVSLESCHSCVQNAWTDILISCPNQTVAVVWYDICMLRYSYQYIAYSVQAGTFLIWHDKNNVTAGELAVFNQTLNEMMDKLKTRAAEDNKRSGKKFATQEGNYSASGKLYTLAQCTPDLSTVDCEYCLTKAIEEIPVCCNGKQGGGAASQSCNIRFETYAYYAIADNAPSPAPGPSDVVADNPTAPPITSGKKGRSISVAVIVAIIVVSIIVSIVLFVLAFLFFKKRSKETYGVVADGEDMSAAIDSIHYSFTEIQAATNNFSPDHKIGEGGFGPVYKGTLPNGQDIAVKRLSRTSVQGMEEFKNEILLLAKLQHRNLVRLLGFSSQGEEKILIYEFVPNKSLDYFIFDGEKQDTLDWPRRQKIIAGIAKGMLYLHEDSRLKIIHRDLKASNILLDENMNPKIADFGMARIFRDDESEAKTSKIAGTQGYMPPEYVVHGQFSVKSDVYSFGVLVLEIISRKRNSNFNRLGLGENSLLSYAWNNWKNGTPLGLLDPVDEHLGDSNYSRNEILNCIQVGLLCVQEDVEQRPTMASVVPMLSSGSITVPAAPRPPAFFTDTKKEPSRPGMDMEESDKSTTTNTTKSVPASVNETLITELYPR